ncbi:MAG TPA: hypothetical protein VH621_02935 [Nitrososphaera sp.]|jgi:hypothetical protein
MNSEGSASEKKGWFRGRHSSNDGAAFLPGADIFKVSTGNWLELLGQPMGQAGRRVSETDLPRLLSQL